MKIRFPLYAKILTWFFLNLIFLATVFYAFFKIQLQLDLDSLLLGKAGDRIQAITDVISEELADKPKSEWDQVLNRFSAAYKINLYLFENDGAQTGGPAINLPPEVKAKVGERRGMRGSGGPPPGKGMGRQMHGAQSKFMVHTSTPHAYWVGVCMPNPDRDHSKPGPLVLLAVSTTLAGGGLFFDFTPWVFVGFAALLCSVLFWLPLVRGVTRTIRQISQTTEKMACGDFSAKVVTRRNDELGNLGVTINQMGQRLADYVKGQKRLLGDIAHELRSPVARSELALGVLDQQAAESQKPFVQDVREEIQQMSALIDELISYSKASLDAKAVKLKKVSVAELAEIVIAREIPAGTDFKSTIPPNLQATVEPELFKRALGNILRNAVRYASPCGPILLEATAGTDYVELGVSDHGPGVQAEELQRIFEPFYRVEHSRGRETGGIGLGLAIVKTCIEACQGTVVCQNRKPSGLEVRLRLRA